MQRPTLTRSMIVLAAALCGGAGTAWAAGKAHEHGAVKLGVAIEGNKLTIAMEAPLDNLLGFERAPRTDAERKAAADVLARLRSPDKGTPLFVMDPAAGCTLDKAEVQAPVLEPGAKPAAKDEHADLDASYEFTCAKPGELRTLDIGLFDAYKRIQRINVQVAGPKGQAKVTLKRSARKVQLGR
ncbi:MAG: DUF2796 domain-containing protein [Rubrivivax sp.]|nr:DUF2796 domain-containing protein [Rubrivivax sp.]